VSGIGWYTPVYGTTTTNGFWWNNGITTGSNVTITNATTMQINGPTTYQYPTYQTWRIYTPPPETPEQRTTRETPEQRTTREEARRQARQEQAEATERARTLLRESLTSEQWQDYEQRQSFRVISSDGERTYRLRHGRTQNIDLLGPRDDSVASNEVEVGVRRRYCIHIADYDIPVEDNLLCQKLLLEADEERFLQVAIAS
jgi:hypothetical protein